jgi:D-alanyl-D-alanine carboxypeptidase
LVGVWYPGQGDWTIAAGIGDLETAAPMRLDDHVRIASITKTFVATVVLQLVDEGMLSLDDRLEPFITGIPNGDEITIRQLLNMTAGIYSYINDPVIAVDYDRDPLLPFIPEQAVAIVRAHGEADFPPGSRSQYSDTNYILLGLIIEQVTGRSVAAEIAERIIVPLGLTQTSFAATPEMPDPYAHGYAVDHVGAPLRDVTRSNPDVAWAAGAMISTMDDLRVWVDALVAGSLLSPTLQAERLAIEEWRSEPVRVGYGLGILEIGGLLGHNGGIMGYGSWMMRDPETGATLVVVTNQGSTTGGIASVIIFGEITDLLFPDRGLVSLVPLSIATPTP